MVLAASLLTAGALALVVYLASTSLPYLVTAPTTDPGFGKLNACLLQALPVGRLGYAVSPDGQHAAAFAGNTLVVCETQPSGEPTARTLPLSGARDAAYDFTNTLWVATEPMEPAADAGASPPPAAGLWRIARNETHPVRVGDVAPISLAGHAQGVVVLEASGRLFSLSGADEVTGHAALPGPPTGDVQLTVDVEGERVALIAGRGVFAYRALDLRPLRAEGPCEAEYLWWSTEPGKAIVACGPKESWALTLQVDTGEREAAPPRTRVRSTLAQRAKRYVQSCEQLPCSAPAP